MPLPCACPRLLAAVVLGFFALTTLRAQESTPPPATPKGAAPLATHALPILPPGYRLVYEQHFDDASALRQFVFSDPAAWDYAADEHSFALELVRQSKYTPAVRSPFNIALLADRVFGDFILDVDLIQTGKEYGHRDMCLFFGVQDATHFYYAHIATRTDDHAHNVFIVNNEPRTRISTTTTPGVNWGLNVWHHVRLIRTGGEIAVYFDAMDKPIMTANNTTFQQGWIGLGSFDDTGKADNLRIWAPNEPQQKRCTFFQTKP